MEGKWCRKNSKLISVFCVQRQMHFSLTADCLLVQNYPSPVWVLKLWPVTPISELAGELNLAKYIRPSCFSPGPSPCSVRSWDCAAGWVEDVLVQPRLRGAAWLLQGVLSSRDTPGSFLLLQSSKVSKCWQWLHRLNRQGTQENRATITLLFL